MSTQAHELHGAEAIRYAEERLRLVRTCLETWESEYADDSSGEVWILDYPHAELHGGGSPRLRLVR